MYKVETGLLNTHLKHKLNRALVRLFKKCLAFGLTVYQINKALDQNGKNRDQDLF